MKLYHKLHQIKNLTTKNYISPKAIVSDNVIIGQNVKIFANSFISPNTIIEDNVIIGYPSTESQTEIRRFANRDTNDLYSFYDNNIKAKTSINSNSIVRSGAIIYEGSQIDKYFDCGHNAIIRENTSVKSNSFIYPNTLIGRDVQIGAFCRIAGTICNRTKVGNFSAMLGHTVHKFQIPIPGLIELSPVIGEGVTIGREVVIIGNVFIGDFATVITNSVVTKNVNDKSIYGGIPARLVKKKTDDELKELFDYIDKKRKEL